MTELFRSLDASCTYGKKMRTEMNLTIGSERVSTMNIELIKLTTEYREQLFEMLTEWKNDIIENHTDMSPWKIWVNDFHNLEYYIENLDTKENDENGWVPDTTLFCFDKYICRSC